MKKSEISLEEKQQIIDAANEIWFVVRGLPSLRAAMEAVCFAHVHLLEEDGTTENDLRARMKDVENFIIAIWAKRRLTDLEEEKHSGALRQTLSN